MALLLRSTMRGEFCPMSMAASDLLRVAVTISHGGHRTMAIQVDVEDNRVHQALAELNRRSDEEGLTEEMKKRQYHMNGSDRKFERNKRSYKRAVGRVVSERVKWVLQLRPDK